MFTNHGVVSFSVRETCPQQSPFVLSANVVQKLRGRSSQATKFVCSPQVKWQAVRSKRPHKVFSAIAHRNFTLHHRLLKGGPTRVILSFVATQQHPPSPIHLLFLRISLLISLFMLLPHSEMFVHRLLTANYASKNLLSTAGQILVTAIQEFSLHQRLERRANLGCLQALKLKSVTIADLL